MSNETQLLIGIIMLALPAVFLLYSLGRKK